MNNGNQVTEPEDISDEVTVTEPRPRFTGTYSDVLIGEFRGRLVAIKILKQVYRKSPPAMRRKMRREQEVWAAVLHPNIVPFYGYAENEDVFGQFGALISPWYSNGDAGRFLAINGDKMDIFSRSFLWRGVILGVEYLHTFSPCIVHGDLKPANILIDDNLNPRICDFGLARILSEEGTSGLTTTSEHSGTERYLAYELVASEDIRAPTTCSDIHGLACVGLEFLDLQLPYAHRKNNARGHIFVDIINRVPPAIRPIQVSNSFGILWDLFESCWQINPADRLVIDAVVHLYDRFYKALEQELSADHRYVVDLVISGIPSNKADIPRAGRAGPQPSIPSHTLMVEALPARPIPECYPPPSHHQQVLENFFVQPIGRFPKGKFTTDLNSRVQRVLRAANSTESGSKISPTVVPAIENPGRSANQIIRPFKRIPLPLPSKPSSHSHRVTLSDSQAPSSSTINRFVQPTPSPSPPLPPLSRRWLPRKPVPPASLQPAASLPKDQLSTQNLPVRQYYLPSSQGQPFPTGSQLWMPELPPSQRNPQKNSYKPKASPSPPFSSPSPSPAPPSPPTPTRHLFQPDHYSSDEDDPSKWSSIPEGPASSRSSGSSSSIDRNSLYQSYAVGTDDEDAMAYPPPPSISLPNLRSILLVHETKAPVTRDGGGGKKIQFATPKDAVEKPSQAAGGIGQRARRRSNNHD